MPDNNYHLSKEDADRKAEEKRNQIGIVFENTVTGEVRTATTVEHIAAFFNSSDQGPNSRNKQDFGWKLAPEDLVELENLKNDPNVMERIAAVYQIPAEDVADYNVLKYMAAQRFASAKRAQEAEGKDYESDYDRRVREAREGKSKSQQRRENVTQGKPVNQGVKEPKPRTVNRDAGDGQFVSDEEAKENPGTTVTETVKPNSEEKVAKTTQKEDNGGKDKQ